MRSRIAAVAFGILIAIGLAQAQVTINRNFGTPVTLPISLTSGVNGTLPVANGGTNVTSATDDNILVGNGTTWQLKALSDCQDTGGNHANYTASSNTWSCGTSLNQGATPTWTSVHSFAASDPQIVVRNGSAGADAKNTQIRVNTAGTYSITSADDATPTTGVTNALTAARTGTAWTSVNLGNATDNPAITMNGITITPVTGSFVATFDDACTTSPTITFTYQKVGTVVTMAATANSGFTCTGDSTNFATTGTPVPAAIRPTNNASTSFIAPDFQDNGTSTGARIQISSAGNVVFSKVTTGTTSASWTAAGVRTFYGNGLVTTYLTNN